MAHKHPVYDNDGYFVLDPKTKTLKNESGKESIVQFDHNSEEIRFKFPKIIEGHDMSKVDLIQVHFANTSTGTSASLRSTNMAPINITETLKECEDDPEYLTCSWLIGEESTQLAGSLKFKLKFVCYGDDETPAYKMNTLYYDKYQVLESEDSSEGIIDIYQDILLDIERRLAEAENKSITPEQIAEAVGDYFEDNPIEFKETDPTVPAWAKEPNKPRYTADEVGALSSEDGSVTAEKLEENLRQDITDVIDGAFPPSKNLLKLPDYLISAEENNGVAINIEDGLFTINGTATADARLVIPIPQFAMTAGTYSYAVRNLKSENVYGCNVYIKDTNYANISNIYTALYYATNKKVLDIAENTTIGYISIFVGANTTINQSFNIQLETGEFATSYVPANDRTFGGDTARTVENLEANVVFASSFHAVGDGVTDDTEALQRAINYCSENYKLLKLDSGKTYLISSPLVWNNNSVYFDGNFATITVQKRLSSLILLDCTDINDANTTRDWGSRNYRQQVVKNLVLDCKGVADCGLRIEKGIKTHCSDITINDPVTYGMFVNQNGWENFISNVHITRLLDELGCVGLYVYGSDNTFDNIVIIGCQVGVVNIGADNHYSKIHPWSTTEALDNLKQSISFDCRWGYCSFNQCIGDSTNIIFKISNNARVVISNCANAWSDGYVESREAGSNPYLFYFDETHTAKGSDVTVSACYFKPKVSETDTTFKCHYSNLTDTDAPILIDRATTGWENQPVTIESQFGSIDTALERIIEIQENLIGGVTE